VGKKSKQSTSPLPFGGRTQETEAQETCVLVRAASKGAMQIIIRRKVSSGALGSYLAKGKRKVSLYSGSTSQNGRWNLSISEEGKGARRLIRSIEIIKHGPISRRKKHRRMRRKNRGESS